MSFKFNRLNGHEEISKSPNALRTATSQRDGDRDFVKVQLCIQRSKSVAKIAKIPLYYYSFNFILGQLVLETFDFKVYTKKYRKETFDVKINKK